MVTLAVSGVLALALLVLLILAVALVRRYPPAGIGLAALIILPLWEVPYPPPIFAFAGLSVTLIDAVTLVLFIAGVLEFAQMRENLQGWLTPWLFLGALIAISLLRGAAAFGTGAAVNEARAVIWFFFAMTWAFAIRPDRLRLHTVSLVLGWALVLVATYHGVRYGIGGPSTRVAYGDYSVGRSGRVLISGQAMALLLCAGTALLGTSDSGKGRSRFSGIVFLGVVLISQHRSVWIATIFGMTAVLIAARGIRERSRALVVLATGAWLALAASTLRSGVVDSAVNTDTLEWRTSSWTALISQAIDRGPVSLVFGEPFGSGFLRKISLGLETGLQAHNWYVEVLLRLGLIGLAVIAAMLITAVVKSRTGASVWMFLLVAVGVFAFAYALDWFLAPWLAVAMVLSLRGGGVPHESRPSERPSLAWVGGRVGASTGVASTRP